MERAVATWFVILVCSIVGGHSLSCGDLASSMDTASPAAFAFTRVGQPFTFLEEIFDLIITVRLNLPMASNPTIHRYNPDANVIGELVAIFSTSNTPVYGSLSDHVYTNYDLSFLPGNYILVIGGGPESYYTQSSEASFLSVVALPQTFVEFINGQPTIKSNSTLSISFYACYSVGTQPPLPTPSSTRSPTPSPSPSPSLSRMPLFPSGGTFDPLDEPLSPWFGAAVPSFGILVPQDTPPVGVQSAFSELVYVFNNAPAQLGGYVVDKTVDDNSTTVSYTAVDSDNMITLEQSFTFHVAPTSKSFDGLDFEVAQSSVKWSVRLSTSSSPSLSFSKGITLRYTLGSLNITSSSSLSLPIQQGLPKVVKRSREPVDFMTTYYLLTDVVIETSQGNSTRTPAMEKRQLMAKVEVLDVALADGVRVPLLNHNLITVPNEADNSTAFVLELQFAGFNTSLEYDPSVGLGQLLGTDAGKGSETSTGLIVGVSVGVGVAVLVVVSVLVVGAVLIPLAKRRMRTNSLEEVNLGELEENGRGDTHKEL